MMNIKKRRKILFTFTAITFLPILNIVSCESKTTSTDAQKVAADKAKFSGFSQSVLLGSRTLLSLGAIDVDTISVIDVQNRPQPTTQGVTRTFKVIKVDRLRGKVQIEITFVAGSERDTFKYFIRGFAKTLSDAQKVAADKAKFSGFSQNVPGSALLSLGAINANIINTIDVRNRPQQTTQGVTRTFEVISVDGPGGRVQIKITFVAGSERDTFQYYIGGFTKTFSDAERVAAEKAKFSSGGFSQNAHGRALLSLGAIDARTINTFPARTRNRQTPTTQGVTKTFEVIRVDRSRGRVQIEITFVAGNERDTFKYFIKGFAKILSDAERVAADKAKFSGFSQNTISIRWPPPLGAINVGTISVFDARNRLKPATQGVTRTFEVIKVDRSRGKVQIEITFVAGSERDTFKYFIRGFAKKTLSDA